MKGQTSKPICIMDFRGTYKGGGGPDKTILNSAAQHDKKRVSVLVTYLRDPADKEFQIAGWAARLGINYIDVPDAKLLDFHCLKELKKIIIKHKITLVHAHDDKTSFYAWILKLAMPRLHIIFTCHLHSPYTKKFFESRYRYWKFFLRRRIQIFLMKRFQKPILAVSDDTKKCMIADGINEKDIKTLHNAIDIDAWRPELGKKVLREELNILPDEFFVGTVARIAQKHKDLPTFYQVAAEVIQQIPNVKFVIVGDGHGEELIKAKKQVLELGLKDVVLFTGHRTDLLNIYASFDLFLMTSLTEGLPNTVLEAMTMEVPVISTLAGGVAELVIENETGFLCNIGDCQTLSNKVISLLENENTRKQFARLGRKRVEDYFSFKTRVKKMEDFYEMYCENIS